MSRPHRGLWPPSTDLTGLTDVTGLSRFHRSHQFDAFRKVCPSVSDDHPCACVTDEQVDEAKALFLRFSGDTILETTTSGQVLAKSGSRRPGRIYVKGLLVAEEPNFLFSYNITALNTPLRRALNRERSNVGRTAYTDRVKKILTSCTPTPSGALHQSRQLPPRPPDRSGRRSSISKDTRPQAVSPGSPCCDIPRLHSHHQPRARTGRVGQHPPRPGTPRPGLLIQPLATVGRAVAVGKLKPVSARSRSPSCLG
jgi:hypothetical protein